MISDPELEAAVQRIERALATTELFDAEIEKAVRAKPGGRWLYDCRFCGTPKREHGDECVFTADQCKPQGIRTRRY